MVYRGHRKFIAAIVSVSILLTGLGASQAQARDHDAARAVAALLGLAVIGAIIADERKEDRRRRQVVRHHDPVKARPLPRRVNRKLLPQDCLRSFGTGDGRIRMFPVRCLQRNYSFTDSLPLRCERRVRTDRGIRRGYAARCLRRHGYQLARL